MNLPSSMLLWKNSNINYSSPLQLGYPLFRYFYSFPSSYAYYTTHAKHLNLRVEKLMFSRFAGGAVLLHKFCYKANKQTNKQTKKQTNKQDKDITTSAVLVVWKKNQFVNIWTNGSMLFSTNLTILNTSSHCISTIHCVFTKSGNPLVVT